MSAKKALFSLILLLLSHSCPAISTDKDNDELIPSSRLSVNRNLLLEEEKDSEETLPSKIKKYIKSHKKIVIPPLLILFLFLLIRIICRIYLIEEELIFVGEKLSSDYELGFNQGYSINTFETKDKRKLCYLESSEEENTNIVVSFHGNHTNLERFDREYLNIPGIDYYEFEYTGYGKSEGKIRSEKDFYADIEAFFKTIIQQEKNKNKKIFLVGRSLGGAAAIYLASEHPEEISGLVTDSTFTSIYDVACSFIIRPLAFIIRPFAFCLIRYKLDNLTKIEKVTCPLLLFHGTKDDLVPFNHMKRLEKAYKKGNKGDRKKVEVFISAEGKHKDRHPRFFEEVEKFIKENQTEIKEKSKKKGVFPPTKRKGT